MRKWPRWWTARYLLAREICKHLGVNSDTIYRWIDKIAMTADRMGCLLKFKKNEIDKCV